MNATDMLPPEVAAAMERWKAEGQGRHMQHMCDSTLMAEYFITLWPRMAATVAALKAAVGCCRMCHGKGVMEVHGYDPASDEMEYEGTKPCGMCKRPRDVLKEWEAGHGK